ncbi:hypothetical protein QUA00_25330 [Microcoleus sp. T2B6]|uniref:hypothetical protein n=1 Tax=Microcoleus sp. T2B6 TaxID=3055424 RepID=UPI002FD76E87
MKLNTLIIGLLIGFLVACDRTQTNSQEQSTPQLQKVDRLPETKTSQPTNPFDSISFPQASCSDKLPKDAKADNFKTYPVWMPFYNSMNVDVETVQSKFCGDADYNKTRIDKEGTFILVAQFSSQERAYQFQQVLVPKLDGVEVGEAIITATKRKPQPTKDAVAKASQLIPQQVEQLKNIVFKDSLGKLHKVDAVLPTYLPPGFKLHSFKPEVPPKDPYGYDVKYQISYKNASNNSFTITAYAEGPGAGGPPYAPKLKAVNSPAFGEVIIGYKEFDKTSDKSSIDVIISVRPPLPNNTSENSPSDGDSSAWNYHLHSDTLSLAEATKIVESLSYLYPDEPRNITLSNDLSNDPQWAPQ